MIFSLTRDGFWLLFNSVLALLFSWFHVIRDFDSFLHWGWVQIRRLSKTISEEAKFTKVDGSREQPVFSQLFFTGRLRPAKLYQSCLRTLGQGYQKILEWRWTHLCVKWLNDNCLATPWRNNKNEIPTWNTEIFLVLPLAKQEFATIITKPCGGLAISEFTSGSISRWV